MRGGTISAVTRSSYMNLWIVNLVTPERLISTCLHYVGSLGWLLTVTDGLQLYHDQ